MQQKSNQIQQRAKKPVSIANATKHGLFQSSPAWARTIAKNVGKTMRDQLGGPTRGPIAVKSRRHRLRVATSDRALVVTFRRDSKSSREFD